MERTGLNRVFHHVSGRLSLRPPQAESLSKLVRALAAAPELLGHERATQEIDLSTILATLKGEFPKLTDFEREFPSLCFALATGVGKTRLMGAFIAYLHLAHSINNFFVLAPNLTIYNKLITDFTPNTPKYVFKGIGEFAINAPRVITGDNYDQQNILGGELLGEVRINIFNISKINSEVRGGKEPRIKRMKEVLGEILELAPVVDGEYRQLFVIAAISRGCPVNMFERGIFPQPEWQVVARKKLFQFDTRGHRWGAPVTRHDDRSAGIREPAGFFWGLPA